MVFSFIIITGVEMMVKLQKVIKLTLCFILVIFTIGFFPFHYNAVEYEDDPEGIATSISQTRFTYILTTNTAISIVNGQANCLASVTCNNHTTNSCSATLYLQRRQTGTSTWYTLFSVTDYGTFYASATEKCNVVSGYQYRVKAKYTATGNESSETTYSYSKIATVN